MRVPRLVVAAVSGAAITVVVMQTGAIPSAGARPAVASPGAVTRLFMFRNTTGGPAAAVAVGGYSYQPTCTVTGKGTKRKVEILLRIKPLGGQTYQAYGAVQSQANDTGPIVDVTDNFHHRTGASDFFVFAPDRGINRFYYSISLVGNDKSFQQLTFRLSANSGHLAQYEARCMLEGEVVPTTA